MRCVLASKGFINGNIEYNRNVDILDRLKHLVGQKITSFQSSDFWVDMRINGKSHYETDIQNMIDGKTFKIDSVNRYTFYMTSENNPDNHFSLSILDSDYLYEIDFAWVCHGYFEKMKKLFLDKDLVYVHQDQDYDLSEYHTRYRFMDYNTKRNLTKKVPCNSVWKCTDVLVISDKEKFFNPVGKASFGTMDIVHSTNNSLLNIRRIPTYRTLTIFKIIQRIMLPVLKT